MEIAIADGMKNIAENIINSRNVRVKALGSLVNEVNESLAGARKMIRSNAADRKAMSKEQAAELAHFADDLASNVGAKLKGFQEQLQMMSKDRVMSAKELKDRLQSEARGLRNSVKRTLSSYSKDHAEMSEAQRRNLHGYVNGIVKDVEGLTVATRDMMTSYRTDMRKAGNIWGNMTRTLAELPVIHAGEKSGTVAKSFRKIQKRKKNKK